MTFKKKHEHKMVGQNWKTTTKNDKILDFHFKGFKVENKTRLNNIYKKAKILRSDYEIELKKQCCLDF